MRKFTLIIMMVFTFTGFSMAQIMEDYESIKMNLMAGGAEDLSSLTVVPNPDPTGINPSSSVVEFVRDKDGVPWGGFWSTLPSVVDVTTNKFVHVKVWKSRISPIKFKLEGGAAGTLEIASKNPQTLINQWEDIVFDFSEKTGTYPTIAFMPDFEDPLTLTEDITIYFDDFVVNNDPNPMGIPEQEIHVDMTDAGLVSGDLVYISGAIGGIHGSWPEPGTNANNLMLDPDGDKIYSITMNLSDGLIAFKFFKGAGWGGGDSAPGGDRTLSVKGSMDVVYKFGVDGVVSQTSDEKVVFENFESLKMNIMEGGTNGSLMVVPNPYKTSLNNSDYVVKYVRNFDSQPWGGFYGTLEIPVDFTTNKYVHVKVWKPRISPVKFKIEGPDFEVASMNPQTITEGWEDMVFDFSAATGNYTKIVFMPDFEDPLTLTADIEIYFDDILLNNDPNPAVTVRENKFTGKVQMYPNPVNNELFINTNVTISKVTITSMHGQVVRSYNLASKSNTTINTADLSSGMYFVTFTGIDGSRQTQKLIKQ